ncbi:MAG: enoyl-CoA hydratase-related protein [Hyphomonadaceae bacterium]
MSEKAVLVEREGHVLVVTINRPDQRNAVNKDVHLGIGMALEEADHDPNIWAVILTGAGDKAFCAGADLKAVSRGERLAPDDPAQQAWGFAGYVTHHISKPTIAAVNGFALGGGTEITLASDLAVAADTASFGLPEVKRGILAGAGGAFRLRAQLPPKIAMEMLLTGDPIPAPRALELGLINAVAPQAQTVEAALKLAARITVNAPLSVQASKRIALGMVKGRIAREDEGWALTRDEAAMVMRSEDAKEGPLAFAEKRAPVWKAR